MASVEELDAVLPQTQCGECGYPGCRPYAEALAGGQEKIDRCPPGGVETVKALASLLRVDPHPFLEQARLNTRPPQVAKIRESECIGCTKCIQACPVDAILGSAKQMHAVIAHECTGCGLCLEPCPVDCIELVTLPQRQYDPDLARSHYHAREVRLLKETHEQQQSYREKKAIKLQKQGDDLAKMDYILQAMARVKAKKDE